MAFTTHRLQGSFLKWKSGLWHECISPEQCSLSNAEKLLLQTGQGTVWTTYVRQAPLQWYLQLQKCWVFLGVKCLPSDTTAFFKELMVENGRILIVILVDDLVILSSCESSLTWTVNKLLQVLDETDEGSLNWYPGIYVRVSEGAGIDGY